MLTPHDFIELTSQAIADVFAKAAPLYKQGLSLREIELRTGFSKTTIRKELIRRGIPMRVSREELRAQGWRKRGKRNAKPRYGFYYHEGQVTRNPKEYSMRHAIHGRWKSGQSANSIATWLNGKRIPSPMGKKWSWNSVTNIIDRFKSRTVILKGGHYELR